MSWWIRMAMKAKGINMTDVLNQQTADDLIHLLKELLL